MRIVVGISGGVDSAVAALMLKRDGHEVIGAFMQNWDEDDDAEGACTALADWKSALAVCEHLDIPLHTVNFAAAYRARVFEYFLAEHRAGRTPNPDVLCNKEIKFRDFFAYAAALGAERVATGHYARVVERDGRMRLLKGRDPNKDQSYFLCAVDRAALAHTLFPLGELTKPDVRAAARAANLPNHDRPDSTGICSIGERDYKNFIARYLPPTPGDILSLDGAKKGRHDGVAYYTLGQRHGLGIGGAGAAWYVIGKDVTANALYVAQGNDEALYHRALIADAVHWLNDAPAGGARLAAKTRYRQADQTCRTEPLSGGRLRVVFAEPQRALTPGQSVVFYADDECLGGARIVEVETNAANDARRAASC